jgi:hypothetical protein
MAAIFDIALEAVGADNVVARLCCGAMESAVHYAVDHKLPAQSAARMIGGVITVAGFPEIGIPVAIAGYLLGRWLGGSGRAPAHRLHWDRMTPDRPRRQRRGRSVRAMVVAGPTSPTLISSSDIGVYELDQLFRGFIGAGAVLLPDQAFANVILDHFGNETVQRTAAGGGLLQHRGAARIAVQRALDRLHLAANAAEAAHEFGFFVVTECHGS